MCRIKLLVWVGGVDSDSIRENFRGTYNIGKMGGVPWYIEGQRCESDRSGPCV